MDDAQIKHWYDMMYKRIELAKDGDKSSLSLISSFIKEIGSDPTFPAPILKDLRDALNEGELKRLYQSGIN